MRLSPKLKFLVALATIAPLFGFFSSAVFMAAVTNGLWDRWARFFPAQLTESVGWSVLLATGAVFAALHLILVAFYLLHLVTNHAAPVLVRLLFAVGFVLVPILIMAFYFSLYILPEQPPAWALKAPRFERETT